MSATKTGALIVMERATRLGEYISTGTMLDANVSSGLLENIFVPNTPLHDGAVIIRNNKIHIFLTKKLTLHYARLIILILIL